MNEPTISVKVAGVPLKVPVVGDEATTRRVVAGVESRFRDIEASATRIDSQAFALQTAVAYALDLEQARMHQAEQEKALARALDGILTNLRELLEASEEEGN
jgi:Cell division protein ZapA